MWPYAAQNSSHNHHRYLHLCSRVTEFTHFLLSVGVQHRQGEHSQCSWPRPRLVWSSVSKPKSFCMSIKGCSQIGKHQDVSHCPGLEAGEISQQRGKWIFFFCLELFRLGKRRHQEETDRKGMEEYFSWSPEENGD